MDKLVLFAAARPRVRDRMIRVIEVVGSEQGISRYMSVLDEDNDGPMSCMRCRPGVKAWKDLCRKRSDSRCRTSAD